MIGILFMFRVNKILKNKTAILIIHRIIMYYTIFIYNTSWYI